MRPPSARACSLAAAHCLRAAPRARHEPLPASISRGPPGADRRPWPQVAPAAAVPALACARCGFDQRLGERPRPPLDAEFRDEQGRTVKLGDYFGKKPVVLSLVYYQCPMLCTLALNGLTSALSVLKFDVGQEFEVVTVSFEPKDTPELAAAKKDTYLKRYKRAGAEKGWHFLTGDTLSIMRLTRAVGFRYAWDERTQASMPTRPASWWLTPDGRLSRATSTASSTPPRDLRLALVEASASRKIGTPVDQPAAVLLPLRPGTGKYVAAIMIRLVRLGGVLTVLGLALVRRGMLRRERVSTARTRGDGPG